MILFHNNILDFANCNNNDIALAQKWPHSLCCKYLFYNWALKNHWNILLSIPFYFFRYYYYCFYSSLLCYKAEGEAGVLFTRSVSIWQQLKRTIKGLLLGKKSIFHHKLLHFSIELNPQVVQKIREQSRDLRSILSIYVVRVWWHKTLLLSQALHSANNTFLHLC